MPRKTYSDSGINDFYSNSIDSHAASNNLPDTSISYTQGNSREINYDNAPTTGTLGSKVQIGNSIVLDGNNEKISIIDGTNEVVRIGELDG